MKYKQICRYDLLLHENIELLLNMLLLHIRQIRAELNNSYAGTLYIKRNSGGTSFTEYFEGREYGIGRDMERVHKLARIKYLRILIKNIEASYKEVQKLFVKLKAIESKFDPDPLLKTYKAQGLDTTDILYSPKQRKWMNQTFRKNESYPDSLEHVSNGGIVTRSKSEKLIANRLEEWNVTFIYELPLILGGKRYYPDFTILKDNGEIIYWEHFGMMSDDDYFMKSNERHREYRANGLCDHTNLIITWEEDLLDMSVIDHIIRTRICC